MGQTTKISWTHHTANLWWGCSEVHAGCDSCYARVLAARVGKADAWRGVRYAVESVWASLKKWQRDAAAAGATRRVFCGSMMDIFEKSLPVSDWSGKPLGMTTGDLRDRLFGEVVPACPDLEFQLLTKRPGNVTKYVPPAWLKEWPRNVITGASVVDQETANTLIPQLQRVPGRLFLSMEPLLERINLSMWLYHRCGVCKSLFSLIQDCSCGDRADTESPFLGWIIAGGESGGKARPMHPDWVRSIRDQCRAAGVPFLFKQWGEWRPDGQGTPYLSDVVGGRNSHQSRALFPDGTHLPDLAGRGTNGDGAVVIRKLGNAHSGHLLDGVEWHEFPEPAPTP